MMFKIPKNSLTGDFSHEGCDWSGPVVDCGENIEVEYEKDEGWFRPKYISVICPECTKKIEGD